MGHLTALFPDQFTGNREDWKKVLQRELKVEDVGQKLSKNTLEGLFEILTLEAQSQVIPNSTSWKKASQTYSRFDSTVLNAVEEDLDNGVRVFFLDNKNLSAEDLKSIQQKITSHKDAKDMEIILLDQNAINSSEISFAGGTHLQELGNLTLKLIEWAKINSQETNLNVFITVDSHFFQSIAKIRAFREVSQKIFNELERSVKLNIISLVNTREWTLYERYNNMLRNTASVAGALVGGADQIQTLGYMTPFENETNIVDADHLERSRRMARNTSHILSLESMLGMVQDAAAGSYHIEALTNFYAEESWKLMQSVIVMGDDQKKDFWQKEITNIQEARLKQLNHRKLILSGINDFPNVKEVIGVNEKLKTNYFRLARGFEELRLKVENLPEDKKKKVRIAFWGDYAALNARLNFTKNYFELLGLDVLEPHHSIKTLGEFKSWMNEGDEEEIIVLCAKDEDYAEVAKIAPESQTANFVAGKVEVPGFDSLYGGQNVFEVLQKLVTRLEGNV